MFKTLPTKMRLCYALLGLSTGLMTASCAQRPIDSENTSHQSFYGLPGNTGNSFKHEQAASATYSQALDCSNANEMAATLNYRTDKPLSLDSLSTQSIGHNEPLLMQGLLLSPGDFLEILLEDGDGFNGRYVIDNDGFLKLPLIGNIIATGITTQILENKIELALVRAEIFQPANASVTIQVLNWSSIEVSVAGAVFQPGRVLINEKDIQTQMPEKIGAFGDFSTTRLLSEAMRAASGIRPDAKLDQIILLRNGWQVQLDMTGLLTGEPVKDYPLVAGDRVIVPSTGCFQENLVRPSQITPKGFRVFMSNLIDSAGDNSGAGIGSFSTSLPYGTRLLQAAVSANCIGGKNWTNAPRRVVLASKNPLTGQTEVIERSVEQLMTTPNKVNINPYLMPNDALACYDSDVTNFRDISRTVIDFILPFKLL